jgi:ankyrin repeat protein
MCKAVTSYPGGHYYRDKTQDFQGEYPVCRFQQSASGWVDSLDASGTRYQRHSHVHGYGKCSTGVAPLSSSNSLPWKKEAFAIERLSTLLRRFVGQPNNSSYAYRSWQNMISDDEAHLDPSTSFFYFAVSRFHPTDLKPASNPILGMCVFGFETLLLDWWDHDWKDFRRLNKRGRTSLQLAAISGSVSICIRLIGNGAFVDEQVEDEYGNALAVAASKGNKGVAELLIKSGADVNLQLQCGDHGSALAAASSGGHTKIIELLIDHGAEVNMLLQENALGGSALGTAAKRNNLDTMQLLINHVAEVNLRFRGGYGTALAAAASRGKSEAVALLLASRADVNMQLDGNYCSALTAATRGNQAEVVKQLIEAGADVKMQGKNAYGNALEGLIFGISHFHFKKEILGVLIENGVNIDTKLRSHGSFLTAAAYQGEIDIVELLVESGADVNIVKVRTQEEQEQRFRLTC